MSRKSSKFFSEESEVLEAVVEEKEAIAEPVADPLEEIIETEETIDTASSKIDPEQTEVDRLVIPPFLAAVRSRGG